MTKRPARARSVTRTARRGAGLIVLAIMLAATTGYAQRFIFATDRDFVESTAVLQSELFLYEDGSQLRLTRTPDQSEYDAAVSPDGNWIAYAVLVDEVTRAWEYQVRAIDDETIVARFPVNDEGLDMTRPAGGFPLRWADDERFVAQTADANFDWSVVRFNRNGDSTTLASGYGVALSPGSSRLATGRDGESYLIDIGSGDEVRLADGTPLGWYDDDGVLVFRDDAVYLVSTADGSETLLHDDLGYSFAFAWSPARRYYALLGVRLEQPYLLVYDPDHALVSSRDLAGAVNDISWLDDDTLLFSAQLGEDSLVLSIDLTGRETVLVESFGSDFAPLALPFTSP